MEALSLTNGPGEYASFCRICTALCGTRVTVDSGGQIIRTVGDDQNPLSSGYACFKGLQSGPAHQDDKRLTHPLKRQPDGSYARIPLEQALDEIAERIASIVAERGPKALGLYAGSGAMMNASAFTAFQGFLKAMGTDQYYTAITIDQSAKMVAAGRMGTWGGGAVELDDSDVLLIFGANPLISHGTLSLLGIDPVKRLKRARARGMKLILVDPRRTETSAHADLLVQPFPGEDAAIAAGLIRLILSEGWEDKAFCERYVGAERMAALKKAVDPFTPEMVEQRAGLEQGSLHAIADMFARQHTRGQAVSGTGPNMSQYSNMAVHMVQTLNVVCGRFPREGDQVRSVDMFNPLPAFYAEVRPASRPWEKFAPSRIRGAGNFFGEKPAATLTDEILTPGPDQVRALIVSGGNPMWCLPDRDKTVQAMRSLDLLVVIDPWNTPTAREADYVLPPTMQYERADLPPSHLGFKYYNGAWGIFTPAIVAPPPGAEVVDDWYVFWALAKRLGVTIDFAGRRMLEGDEPPTTEELLAILLEGGQTSLEELRQFPHGRDFPVDGGCVLPPRPEAEGRFDVMPTDVDGELQDYLAKPTAPQRAGRDREFTHLLSVRRMRDVFNSLGTQLATVRKRNKYNPAHLNGEDLAELGLVPGDCVEVVSSHGRIRAIVERDDTLRQGVVSLSHGWGGTPGKEDLLVDGTSINQLIDTDRNYEDINAMPHMSAVPVRFERVRQAEPA